MLRGCTGLCIKPVPESQDAPAIAEMCDRYETPFILDGITSIGSSSQLRAWNVEAAAIGAQKYTDLQESPQ